MIEHIGDAALHTGDCIERMRDMPAESVNTCVTSPPYFGLRDYGHDGQIGLEPTPDEFVAALVAVFREVRRVLRDDGTVWLNLGDSYASSQSSNGGYSEKSTLAGFTNPNTKGRQALQAAKPRKIDHGAKAKDLLGIPWRVAFALQQDGWYLRQDIIWHKPNPMPESVRDRCTKAHEYIFMLTKSARYYYDTEAIKEEAKYSGLTNQDGSGFKNPQSFNGKHKDGYRSSDKQRGHGRRHAGFNDRWDNMTRKEQCSGMRNKRSVWTVATKPYAGAHFATFPPDLIEPCILAGAPQGGVVLDPFSGSGTTGLVALKHGRKYVGCELNPEYQTLARERLELATAQGRLFA